VEINTLGWTLRSRLHRSWSWPISFWNARSWPIFHFHRFSPILFGYKEKMWLSTISATPACYSKCIDQKSAMMIGEEVYQLAQHWLGFCLVYLAVNHGQIGSDIDKSIPTINQLICGGDKGDRWGCAKKIFSLGCNSRCHLNPPSESTICPLSSKLTFV
jgi:hypothetical protein